MLLSFCCISFVFKIIYLFLIKLISFSLYCLTFVGCFDWRSCELFVSLLMKGFLEYCTRLISKIMLRWSDDDIYPNDGIPQAVINWDISLEHNTKSIIFGTNYECIGFIFNSVVVIYRINKFVLRSQSCNISSASSVWFVSINTCYYFMFFLNKVINEKY